MEVQGPSLQNVDTSTLISVFGRVKGIFGTAGCYFGKVCGQVRHLREFTCKVSINSCAGCVGLVV